jgi:hypothetical protein
MFALMLGLSILGFLVLLALFFLPVFQHLKPLGKMIGFATKWISALLLLYTYTQLYPNRSEADVFKYFDDGVELNQIRKENPGVFTRIMIGNWTKKDLPYLDRMHYWFRSYDHGLSNDNRMVIRINALVNMVSQGYYPMNVLFFLLLSFIGSYYLFRFFLALCHEKWMAFACAFLIPSTVFWSSGILKEGLVMCALGLLLFSLKRFLSSHGWRHALVFGAAFFVLMHLKIYILVSLLPFLVIGVIFNHFGSTRKSLLFGMTSLLLLFLIQALCIPNWNVLSILQGKQFDFIQMAEAVHAGSRVPIHRLTQSYASLLSLLPVGIWNVMYYPDVTMLKNPQSVAAYAENVLFWLLMVGGVVGIFYNERPKYWTVLSLMFVFLVFGIIGITAPVVGAMVRYKAPVLPFFLFSLLLLQPKPFKVKLNQLKFFKWINTQL